MGITKPRESTDWLWVYGLVGVLIVLLPLISTRFLPLIDYPVHLSRQFVLHDWHYSAALQSNYLIDWGIKPNLAMDLVVQGLAVWFSVELASKIFACIAFIMPTIGVTMLARALHGKTGLLPLLALCTTYNLAWFGGFLNFLFSAGLSLVGFALWLKLERKSIWVQSLVTATITTILFFSHIFGFIAFWVLILTDVVTRTEQRLTAIKIIALPALLGAYLMHLKIAGPGISDWQYGSLQTRIASFFAAVRSGFGWSDGVFYLMAVGGLIWILLKPAARPVARVKPQLLIVLVAACLMPQELAGGSALAIRWPLLGTWLLIASMPPDLALSHAWRRPVALTVLALLVLRSQQIDQAYAPIDQDFQEFVKATNVIPIGSRVLAVDEQQTPRDRLIYSHLATLSVMSRHTFVAHMAKLVDQQPILPVPLYQA